MNYYYDVELNYLDKYYQFYEWDENDEVKQIKKIPLFSIEFKDFIQILLNKIKVSNDFLNKIENQTLTKHGNLKYTCIFTDYNNSLAVLFNNQGESIGYSLLKPEDELNIEEVSFTIKKSALSYEILKKINVRKSLRKDEKVKKCIEQELNCLIQNNNIAKLKYLYKELFQKEEDSVEKMAEAIKNQINNKIGENEYKLYQIIKLSYKNV